MNFYIFFFFSRLMKLLRRKIRADDSHLNTFMLHLSSMNIECQMNTIIYSLCVCMKLENDRLFPF